MTAHDMETCYRSVGELTDFCVVAYESCYNESVLDLFHIELLFEVKLNFYRQSKSRDVAHEGSTMKIDYNTRFLLAVRRKRKIIGYFIGAALMCHIPALGLHVKIKFHFKK